MKFQVCNRADMNFASPPPGRYLSAAAAVEPVTGCGTGIQVQTGSYTLRWVKVWRLAEPLPRC